MAGGLLETLLVCGHLQPAGLILHLGHESECFSLVYFIRSFGLEFVYGEKCKDCLFFVVYVSLVVLDGKLDILLLDVWRVCDSGYVGFWSPFSWTAL